jgi:hypothetical protein
MDTELRLDYEDPWQITAALLFLITQWSQSRCSHLVPLIVEHFQILESHESAAFSPLMRRVLIGLKQKWLLQNAEDDAEPLDRLCGVVALRSHLLH